ncbi:hypothetical protein LQ948_12870 [Jiella sp. MQZ9-1]|uniref:Uncharacterized protein n=1 Tax=Jiella flava TaxID=2816857 RepID=A0A939JWI1_9HYPH|nr:hypothetical protein [Jiella flava]MBO0663529.1 hypothetical protein [Jiella flava]MCD2472104.1 hypothetical protein [Jiella flava]
MRPISRTEMLSDAIDGVIHNAVRRDTIKAPALQSELVRLIVAYLGMDPDRRTGRRLNGPR